MTPKFIKSRKFVAVALFMAVGLTAGGTAMAMTERPGQSGTITPQGCINKMPASKPSTHMFRGNPKNDKRCVIYTQKMLITAGYPLAVDGNFGGGTQSKVRAYQSSHGLAVDGRVGPATFRSLLNNYNSAPRPNLGV